MKTAVLQGGATISGLRGMGGVGKTALALKLAAELRPSFPDAQIYLDLQGVSPKPLSAFQAMAHVIRSFHPEAKPPESEAELAGLYRSVLDGKRVLLLMDNAAADRRQVGPLIPPAGCTLLVTSRFHFALPGLRAKDLDELPHEEACKLLLQIEPRIGETAGEIARLCGGLPLALRLAGGALSERPDISPAAYAKRLAGAQARLKLVEASLALSYELLEANLRKRWRELAVFPGTFDGAAAAAVWGLEPEPAEEQLGPLVKSSLVEWSDGRYRLHDLARVFAANRLDPAERAVAERRLAEHYVRVAAAADDLYLKGGESLLLGLRLLDTEWVNIQAGQAWAAARASEDDEAARLCSEYPNAGLYGLDLRQHPRERIRWLELAVAAAQRLGDRAAEGRHLGNLGLAYADLGESRRAIELYEQHLQIARQIGDRRGEGNALGCLGLAYQALGESRRAIEFYEQWLQITREIGDRRGEGGALGNLGNAYAALGEPRRAIEFHEQALIIHREIGDLHWVGADLGNLGNAYADLSELRRAIEFYEQQIQVTREIGDRAGEARASWNLGWVYEKEGDLTRAVELMQVWVDFARAIGHAEAEQRAAELEEVRARLAAS